MTTIAILILCTTQYKEGNIIIWLKQMNCQNQNNPEVWCKPGVYVTKFKNPEMKIENESNKFLEGDSNIEMTFEAGRK